MILIYSFILIYTLVKLSRKKDKKINKIFHPQKDIIIPKCNEDKYINKKIFVSIASYRDEECPKTVEEIFTKAKYPENIYIGICQQNSLEDCDCFIEKYKDNIRIIRLQDTEAKGPTYARYYCSTLYDNEDYFMQIDSHTKFVKDWDIKLMNILENIPDKKVVLTTYPNDWNNINDNDNSIPLFCEMKYKDNILKSTAVLHKPDNKVKQVPFVSGGFFFVKGNFLNDVSYDPDLPHLFLGEEILFTVRLWTHGYNFYAPPERILFHYYERKEAPKYWEKEDYNIWQPLSFKKVRYILNLDKKYHNKIPLEPSNLLGTERSLEDYYKFIGFNSKTKKIEKRFC